MDHELVIDAWKGKQSFDSVSFGDILFILLCCVLSDISFFVTDRSSMAGLPNFLMRCSAYTP